MNTWGLYVMSGLYIIAGIFHFIKPKIYKRVIPEYIPSPLLMVYLSGIAEILLGLGVIWKFTRDIALWGIIIMLLIFLQVHFYMVMNKKFSKKLPKWLLIFRITLQFLLIYWAYIYL